LHSYKLLKWIEEKLAEGRQLSDLRGGGAGEATEEAVV